MDDDFVDEYFPGDPLWWEGEVIYPRDLELKEGIETGQFDPDDYPLPILVFEDGDGTEKSGDSPKQRFFS